MNLTASETCFPAPAKVMASAAQNVLLKQEESSWLSTVQSSEAAATKPGMAPSG